MSPHETFIKQYTKYKEFESEDNLFELEKIILKTKFLIPVYTEKNSKDRIFQKNLTVDFVSLQNKMEELALPLFTTQNELKQLGSDIFCMIVNYYEAHYLALKNNLKLVINPFSINYEIPTDIESKRIQFEGVISPKIELLLKEYKRDCYNNQYTELLNLLKTEELLMPLCTDSVEDYTLPYKEFDNGKFLCLFVSQRAMYKSIPEFKAFEKINLNQIIKIVEMMDFQGILLDGDLKIQMSTLYEL